MTDLFDNVWGDSSEIIVDQFLDVTVPVCFLPYGPDLSLYQHPH